ncbi:MAG: hypothetical protein M5U08_23635 [Burkholderiales bacterium]|nr:hypothetical protein [Burkholderiales bacterium]
MPPGSGSRCATEGVEAKSQRGLLQRHDCDDCQEFLLGKPTPTAAFDKLLGSPTGAAPAARQLATASA